ncbi:MAG: CdaR family protein [Eubacteriales bacterium]|nr:CdaR family protein [Eubacteriales bacterium]
MKNRILNHLGMKVLSLIIAIVVWVIVANVDDYKTTKQVTGIEIEFINGNAITEKNKVYEVPDGTSVDIIIKGRRKLVEKLDSKDFKAVADLSKMSITNAVNVEVYATSSLVAKELTINYTNSAILIAVENKVEKQLPINVRVFSSVEEGYAIRNKTVTPNLITVKGAESVVNDIENVVVDVDVSHANHNLAFTGEPVFLNKMGERMDASKFEYDVKEVESVIEILPTKKLAVRLNTSGEPKEGYAIAGIDYQPTTINVVGDAADLAYVEEITVDDIDVSGASSTMETSINILDYLPEGIALADDNSEIMVKIMIEKLEERAVVLENEDINIVGKRKGYRYTFVNKNNNLITVLGLIDNLEKLDVTNMIPSIDVSKYDVGEYEIKVNFRTLSGIEILKDVTIKLRIEEEEQ